MTYISFKSSHPPSTLRPLAIAFARPSLPPPPSLLLLPMSSAQLFIIVLRRRRRRRRRRWISDANRVTDGKRS